MKTKEGCHLCGALKHITRWVHMIRKVYIDLCPECIGYAKKYYIMHCKSCGNNTLLAKNKTNKAFIYSCDLKIDKEPFMAHNNQNIKIFIDVYMFSACPECPKSEEVM